MGSTLVKCSKPPETRQISEHLILTTHLAVAVTPINVVFHLSYKRNDRKRVHLRIRNRIFRDKSKQTLIVLYLSGAERELIIHFRF